MMNLVTMGGLKKFKKQLTNEINDVLYALKVDNLFPRILMYNHDQYENRRKTYGTESKIL